MFLSIVSDEQSQCRTDEQNINKPGPLATACIPGETIRQPDVVTVTWCDPT